MGVLSEHNLNRNKALSRGIRQGSWQLRGRHGRRYKRRCTSAYTKGQVRAKWRAIYCSAGATIFLSLVFAIISLRALGQGGFAWSFHLMSGIGFALLLAGPFLYERIESLYADNNYEDAEGNLVLCKVKANWLKAIAYTSIAISLGIIIMNWNKFTNPYIPTGKERQLRESDGWSQRDFEKNAQAERERQRGQNRREE